MRTLTSSGLLALVIAAVGAAQTATVRGSIRDTIGAGSGPFVIDGTVIALTSPSLNLAQFAGQQCVLDVVDIGSPGVPLLEVLGAQPTAVTHQMDRLYYGRPIVWRVFAPPGSFALVLVDFTFDTRFLPLGDAGSLLLGPGLASTIGGVADGSGVFTATGPALFDPTFFGWSLTSQALVVGGGQAWFTNPAWSTLRPRY